MTDKLKASKGKSDRISSQLQLTKQQIEFYTQEYQRALEGIKDSNWRITKDMCVELRKLQTPSKHLVDVCEKTMLVLDQPEKSFAGFKNLTKNFGYLKDLMSSVQSQHISEQIINEILPIWKNQTMIQAKLMKNSKCVCLLAQWLSHIVEYSLKKETVNSSKKREPELEKKLKALENLVCELAPKINKVQDEISKLKKAIECKIEVEHEELSENFKIIPEGMLRPKGFPVHRPTASEGLLGSSMNSIKSMGFPKFNDEDLYEGNEIQKSEGAISFEGVNEAIGCCRMRFFCF